MAAALASLYTGVPLRRDTAMTGEISLACPVLPVGGSRRRRRRTARPQEGRPPKERARLKRVPEEVRRDLEVIFASRIEDVLEAALRQNLREARARS
jgi:ATP-dependent Lon protease